VIELLIDGGADFKVATKVIIFPMLILSAVLDLLLSAGLMFDRALD
jgi:hypothetical protein